MNEDMSGNVENLQQEIRKLKILLHEARGIVYCVPMYSYCIPCFGEWWYLVVFEIYDVPTHLYSTYFGDDICISYSGLYLSIYNTLCCKLLPKYQIAIVYYKRTDVISKKVIEISSPKYVEYSLSKPFQLITWDIDMLE